MNLNLPFSATPFKHHENPDAPAATSAQAAPGTSNIKSPPTWEFPKIETGDPSCEIKKTGDVFKSRKTDFVFDKKTIAFWTLQLACTLATPIICVVVAVHYIYIRIKTGYSFREYYGMCMILGTHEIDKKQADLFRKQILTYEKGSSDLTKKTSDTSLNIVQIPIEGTQAKLDALSIERDDVSSLPPSEQKWIIYFPGRRMSYEQWNKFAIALSKETKTNVLMPNYRGILRSGRENIDDPNSPQELSCTAKRLEEDARASVDFLLNQGIAKEQILNYGFSMGGAIASTQTDIALFNDRSFGSLSLMTKALLWAPLLRNIIAWVATTCWGDIDVFSNAKEIQKKGWQLFICTVRQDFYIDYRKASLYSLFRKHLPKHTPPTLLLDYTEPKNIRKRIARRIFNHSTAPMVKEFKTLLKPWLENHLAKA